MIKIILNLCTSLLVCLVAVTAASETKTDYKKQLKEHRLRVAQQHKKTHSVQRNIQRLAKGLNRSIMKAAQQNDPRQFASYQKDMKQFKRSKLKGKAKAKAILQLNEKYKALFSATKSKLHKETKDYHNKMHRIARKFNAVYSIGELWTSIFEWLHRNEEPRDPGQVDQEFSINGNFDFAISNETGHLIAGTGTTSDLGSGFTSAAGISLYAGAFGAESGVAKVIEVPAGYSKLRVTLVTDVDSEVDVLSLGGVSIMSTSSVLEVIGNEFNNELCTNTKLVNMAVAPVLWHTVATVNEPLQITCEIDLQGQPQSVLLITSSLISGAVGLSAGGTAEHSQIPFQFKVQLIVD